MTKINTLRPNKTVAEIGTPVRMVFAMINDVDIQFTQKAIPQKLFEYMEPLGDTLRLSAIVVFVDRPDNNVADGVLRLVAARNKLICDIDPSVHNGIQRDVQWYALESNSTNELRLSSDDNRKGMGLALGWSMPRRMSTPSRRADQQCIFSEAGAFVVESSSHAVKEWLESSQEAPCITRKDQA